MDKSFSVDKDKNTIIFEGILESAYKRKKEDVSKNVIRVTPVDKDIFDSITAYKESGKNYTPTWYKEKNHIMLRSVYDIPVKSVDGDKLTFDEFCERGLIKGAKVEVKIVQKEGAIYPSAIVILEDGDEYDVFEGM